MNFVAPESLIFWTTTIFVIFFFLLKKFAWKPILAAVKSREESINRALASAEIARREAQNLKVNNENILKEARVERDNLLKEAREIKDKIIVEAKEEAELQKKHIIEQTRIAIQSEKNAALIEIKEQLSILSLNIAEKLLKSKLSDQDTQIELIEKMLEEVTLN